MKVVSSVGILLWLGVCWHYCVEVETVDCSNGAGYCNYGSTFVDCYITNNDTQLIKALLRDCSDDSISFTSIYVSKSYVSNEFGNLLIDLDLPTNIQSLFMNGFVDQDHTRVTTFNQNTALTRIHSHVYFEPESNTLFSNFINVRSIQLDHFLLSGETPTFANLQSLTYLHVQWLEAVTRPFDNTILNGSSNVVYLNLYGSSFNGIKKGAFQGLNQLTYLNFGSNKLAYIEEGALTELSSLRQLYLNDNQLSSVPSNVFEGLTDLTYLQLNDNPGFPIISLLSARYLQYLYIQNNGYEMLDSYIFQQMNSLRYLYLDNPFICDCRLQWTSIVSRYGLIVTAPRCVGPPNLFYERITSPQIYSNCSQTQTYKCFDKSISCPTNKVCYNTEDTYTCDCQIGYMQNSSGECEDTNECEATTCQHSCVNTEGSFYCLCEEGYQLANNGYDCDDVNECQDANGGCQLGCRNTMGSFLCYCEYGHQLYNMTHCESEVQCAVIESLGTGENHFLCQGGFNISITNISCADIFLPTTPTMITTTITAAITTAASGCPIGYLQRNNGECIDDDECDVENTCDHICENTEGSFRCLCNTGYELTSNGYGCGDVNECQEGNGGCEFGCRNTMGSYQCSCEYGHKLKNQTHCEEGIECELTENTCFDNQESNYVCKGGYNLTISSPTCPNVNSQQNNAPNETTSTTPIIIQQECELNILSTALDGVFLILITFLIIVIIVLFAYILRKSNRGKGRKFQDSRGPQFHTNVANDESIYNYIEEVPQKEYMKGNVATQSKSKQKNVIVPQDYPGKVQEDANTYYMDMK